METDEIVLIIHIDRLLNQISFSENYYDRVVTGNYVHWAYFRGQVDHKSLLQDLH